MIRDILGLLALWITLGAFMLLGYGFDKCGDELTCWAESNDQ
jgi:hypothetical protein